MQQALVCATVRKLYLATSHQTNIVKLRHWRP